MNTPDSKSMVILGAFLFAGLVALGLLLGQGAMRVKSLERTVAVKGLSECEVPADVAIWPLAFREASNDLNALFETIQRKNALIAECLAGHGIALGRIRSASQGQFSTENRDSTTPHIKKVRVVSTVEYYLAD